MEHLISIEIISFGVVLLTQVENVDIACYYVLSSTGWYNWCVENINYLWVNTANYIFIVDNNWWYDVSLIYFVYFQSDLRMSFTLEYNLYQTWI